MAAVPTRIKQREIYAPSIELGRAGRAIAVLIVGGLGFINWRRPRLRVVLAEITIAIVVVLSLTALLSELPMPGH